MTCKKSLISKITYGRRHLKPIWQLSCFVGHTVCTYQIKHFYCTLTLSEQSIQKSVYIAEKL